MQINTYRLSATGISDSYLIVVVDHLREPEANRIIADASLLSSLHSEPLHQKFRLFIPDDENFNALVPVPTSEVLTLAHEWALGHLDLAYMEWCAKRFPAASPRDIVSSAFTNEQTMLVQLWLRGQHDSALKKIEAATSSERLKGMIRKVRLLPRIETIPPV